MFEKETFDGFFFHIFVAPNWSSCHLWAFWFLSFHMFSLYDFLTFKRCLCSWTSYMMTGNSKISVPKVSSGSYIIISAENFQTPLPSHFNIQSSHRDLPKPKGRRLTAHLLRLEITKYLFHFESISPTVLSILIYRSSRQIQMYFIILSSYNLLFFKFPVLLTDHVSLVSGV